jgi:O-antigen ligase
MDLSKIIGLGVFAGYVPFILLKTYAQVRRSYILYVLYLFPFIDLFITPVQYGGFSVFDGISLISFILIFHRIRFTGQNTKYLVLFFLLLAVLMIGAAQSQYFAEALIPYLKAVLLFFFAKCILEEINEDPGFGLKLIRVLKVVALVSVAFVFLQVVVGLRFTFYAALNTNTNTGAESTLRYPSFFHDAQKYAQFAAMAAFLFLIDTEKTPLTLLKKTGLFLAVVMALILSGGRAAFLGLAVGIVFLIMVGRLKYKLLGLVGVVLVAGIGFAYSDRIPLFNRSESVDESYEIRNNYWQKALRIYDDNQVWGIGIGNYRNYVSQYAQDQYWLMENGDILYFDHPESGYLKFLVEFGIVGFCLSMLFFLVPIGSFVGEYLKHKCYTPFFLIASVISWMVSFVTVYTLSDLRIASLLTLIVCLLIKSKLIFKDICYPRS